jgi:hypothetical protein
MIQRADLHDVLSKHAFNHAVICTFTFDPQFFEGYCLDRFRCLAENNNITIILDRMTYDGLVQLPPSEWPRLANIRYLLHPVKVPGTFHPKLFLFASKEKGLLIVGSANFTRAGLTANGELVGVYRFEQGKREQYVALFRQAFQFLMEVSRRWPGTDLESNLNALLAEAQWLSPDGDEPPCTLHLVHNLDQPLWPQISEGIVRPVETIHFVSRYFDPAPVALTQVHDDLDPKRIVLWTQNGITTMTPAWFKHSTARKGITHIYDVSVLDEDHLQALHAKAIAMVKGRRVRLAFGSANFTTPALFSTSSEGNVELMVIADDLPLSSCDPRRFFDPSGTARHIVDASQLQSAPRETRPPSLPPSPIRLDEASLNDLRLACLYSMVTEMPQSSSVSAVVAFNDGGEARYALAKNARSLVATITDDDQRRCGEGTTIVRIEAVTPADLTLTSNSTYLVNLKDVDTGHSQRRERRIREAQQSAAQFSKMLDELLQLGDTDSLQVFLTYCDIPVINSARPYAFRGPRPPWQGEEFLRAIGERNLRTYSSLHEAAMGFCNRHLRKLKRHCEHASVAGVPNFMHIALAIGNVLRGQVERALIGLETTTSFLLIEEWAQHRNRLEEYLTTFQELMDIVGNSYLPELGRRFKASPIRQALHYDLEALAELSATFLAVRDRVENCRKGTLRVRASRGLVEPPIYPHDLLGPSRWSGWTEAVRSSLKHSNVWLQPTL